MKKIIILLTIIFTTISIHAQLEKLNNYKYVIVDSNFKFLKKTDQYQTSSLTQFLIKKTGIPTFLDTEEIPLKYISERCKGLYVSVTDDSSLLMTKNRIEFKDCYGSSIFNTEYGKSREKEFKKAYPKAIRNAFESIAGYVYEYKDGLEVTNPIAKLDSSSKQEEVEETKETIETLYAQPKENGYQLINDKPEVVFFLIKTKTEHVFIIKDKNGAFYKKDNYWIAETYENGKSVSKKYNVKF
jgi:hypothetical protein